MTPAQRLQHKLEFFGMEDKNPQETEERIRNVLSTIESRFGPSRSANKDIETFAELLAIEA